MRFVPRVRLCVRTAAVVLCTLLCTLWLPGLAGAQNRGFQLNRFEPTAAGEWSFWVDHPWYSKTRYFAAGLSLNYAHDPFVLGQVRFDGVYTSTQEIISHQLTGHFDMAGSFLDRVLLSLSMPVVFLERGNPSMSGGVAPSDSVTVSDPRIGAMVRLYGQPYASPISVNVGGNLWIPLGSFTDSLPQQSTDRQVRGSLKVVLAGLAHHVIWSFAGGVLLRPGAVIGSLLDTTGAQAGSELQLGGAVGYANWARRFAITTEMVFATALTSQAFQIYSTSLELLVGGHYNIANLVQVGLAGGFGALRQPGTPDGRFLFRLAYAPIRQPPPDRDRDGVPDKLDACPDVAKGDFPDPARLGCPIPDTDKDGVLDPDDICPDVPKGKRPDANRPGCPIGDRDKDGVLDPDDACPDAAKGDRPDTQRIGCPATDRDSDGIPDIDDQCPDTPKGDSQDPMRIGCPAGDKDSDGIIDTEDQCPEIPTGPTPDPKRRGCPPSDRDQDWIMDPVDACPDQAGAPSSDPKANGCPNAFVEVRANRIILKEPLLFATKKDALKPKSFAALQALADVLKQMRQIRKVRIELQPGQPAEQVKEKPDPTLRLSRAKVVMDWLIEHTVEVDRLEAQSAGPSIQLAILDPTFVESGAPATAAPAPAPVAPAPVAPAPVAPAPAPVAAEPPAAAKPGPEPKAPAADAQADDAPVRKKAKGAKGAKDKTKDKPKKRSRRHKKDE